MKKIGFVGGSSWTSTQDYYGLLNEGVNEQLGGLNYTDCIIYSLDLGMIQAMGWKNAFEPALETCLNLQTAKAEVIGLRANTAYYFLEDLRARLGVLIVCIIEETAKRLKTINIGRVGLHETIYIMEEPFYIEKMATQHIEVLVPDSKRQGERLHYILKEELGCGIVKRASKSEVNAMIEDLISAGTNGIVLGCTEIPLLIGEVEAAVPCIDTTMVHMEALINFALSDGAEYISSFKTATTQ